MEVVGWKDAEAAKKLDLISPKNYARIHKAPIGLLTGKNDI